MLMTIDAHQTNLTLLKQFYQNPELFRGNTPELFSGESRTNRADTICDLSIFGPTTHRFNGLDANCNRVLCYRDIRHDLELLKNDESVEKIFLELDGPGGEATGCFDLANYISDLAKIKPVIGFINGVSYSANYAFASACSELYISPYSMGGSIGVIYGRREILKENETITYFTTGEAKADSAPETTLDADESARHQAMVDQLGDSFFELVAKNRGINAADVKKLQAKLFSASDLLANGLVDGIKTEEEIKMMMKTSTHNNIVEELKASHEEDKASLTKQITELQTQVADQSAQQAATASKINKLAKSAGVSEVAGALIESNVDEKTAAKKIIAAAAEKDEDISLTSGLDSDDDESYDMQQLIKDA